MHAYCWAKGLIEFGRTVPAGALPIARGPAKKLRNFIEARARHGYRTLRIRGRLAKVPGSDTLLVPGVPEAVDPNAAVDALRAFCDWLGKKPPKGVVVQ